MNAPLTPRSLTELATEAVILNLSQPHVRMMSIYGRRCGADMLALAMDVTVGRCDSVTAALNKMLAEVDAIRKIAQARPGETS